MQSSLSTFLGRNDETSCLVYPVECHVHKEEDSRKVEPRDGRATNDSEPSPDRTIICSEINNRKELSSTNRHMPITARAPGSKTPVSCFLFPVSCFLFPVCCFASFPSGSWIL